MNELRWTLLIIGIMVIAGIYFWDTLKRKRSLRARIESLNTPHRDGTGVHLNPKKEKNIDISGALNAFNAYLKQSRASTRASRPMEEIPISNEGAPLDEPDFDIPSANSPKTAEQTIITIYITAENNRRFTGPDMLQAIESADMQFGEMNIFHYHGPDKKHATRALFSLANIREPGYFEIDKMDRFGTPGLVLFMCLPAEIGGDIAFEIMLDTAHNLAYLLGGELRGADRKVLDAESLAKLRELASHY